MLDAGCWMFDQGIQQQFNIEHPASNIELPTRPRDGNIPE
jgi:hypothetical protein